MKESGILKTTSSICPVCMKHIPAALCLKGKEVFLSKQCKEHGTFTSVTWRGFYDYVEWAGEPAIPSQGNSNCPHSCGLCSDHLQKTCCVILNVTSWCNLDCNFCFAGSVPSSSDPSFEEIRNDLAHLIEKGKTLVQLSGGEPTVRNDLAEIIKCAKLEGAKYVQLNSNGIRLAADRQFVQELSAAGLSFVFLQFDGTDDTIHLKLRNQPLLAVKQKAIDHCAEFNIGVTLVPTLVKGINTNNIGEILQFAIKQSPKVRGVHFQPAVYSGKFPQIPSDHQRLTLDELIHEIHLQSDGLISPENLLPSCCDHPLCGFHGDFIVTDKDLIPLLKRKESPSQCCGDVSLAEKNREFVARRWQRPELTDGYTGNIDKDIHDMEFFLNRAKTHGFTLTAMVFQDAGNIDLSRLRQCSLHVYDKGRLVPFCSYYLSTWNQQ